MKYNEIERLQQLAGIITEIKVNNPLKDFNKVLELYKKTLNNSISIHDFDEDMHYDMQGKFRKLNDKYNLDSGTIYDYVDEEDWNELSTTDKHSYYNELIKLNKEIENILKSY